MFLCAVSASPNAWHRLFSLFFLSHLSLSISLLAFDTRGFPFPFRLGAFLFGEFRVAWKIVRVRSNIFALRRLPLKCFPTPAVAF
jgi:hypothetical protein